MLFLLLPICGMPEHICFGDQITNKKFLAMIFIISLIGYQNVIAHNRSPAVIAIQYRLVDIAGALISSNLHRLGCFSCPLTACGSYSREVGTTVIHRICPALSHTFPDALTVSHAPLFGCVSFRPPPRRSDTQRASNTGMPAGTVTLSAEEPAE